MNPVGEGSDFMGNCTIQTGTGLIDVHVNGVAGLAIVDDTTQTLSLTSFTYPNVTRGDNGAVFTCVIQPSSIVIASLTLHVLCEQATRHTALQ